MSSTPSVTRTLERGLQVLRAFRAERKPLTNSELMRRTGLSRSSVSRLTCTLVNLGYLRRLSGGSGLELAVGGLSLGFAYTKTNPFTQRVHPFMQHIADRFQSIVALGVPDGLDMLYIACRASTQITTLRLDVGSLLPMDSTAIGRAWLWALPLQERQRYMEAIFTATGARATEVSRRIQQSFDELDATGICMVVGEYMPNAYGIALPLRVGRTHTLMALNCGAVNLAKDMNSVRKHIAPVLRDAAQEITAMLSDVDVEP